MKKLIYIFAMVIILATLSSAELIVPTNDNTASKYPVIEPNKDLLSAIYLTNISMNNSYIPYSGAWQDVNLNNRNLMNVNIFEVHNITGHSPIYISDNVLLGKYNISADFFIGNGSRLTDLNFSGIPYTGATANLSMGIFNVSAKQFIINDYLNLTYNTTHTIFNTGNKPWCIGACI